MNGRAVQGSKRKGSNIQRAKSRSGSGSALHFVSNTLDKGPTAIGQRPFLFSIPPLRRIFQSERAAVHSLLKSCKILRARQRKARTPCRRSRPAVSCGGAGFRPRQRRRLLATGSAVFIARPALFFALLSGSRRGAPTTERFPFSFFPQHKESTALSLACANPCFV